MTKRTTWMRLPDGSLVEAVLDKDNNPVPLPFDGPVLDKDKPFPAPFKGPKKPAAKPEPAGDD